MFRDIPFLDYDFDQVLAADHSSHSGTCVYPDQERELDDIYRSFGGFPKSFCLENTTIHQLWWTKDQLDFDQLGAMLGMEVVTISSIRQDPGHTIPYHRDGFYKISKLHPERSEPKVRANIFLEDGKLGHFLQFTLDQQYCVYANWQANTGFVFDSSVLHLSCNAGLEPKYTLQISGFWLG